MILLKTTLKGDNISIFIINETSINKDNINGYVKELIIKLKRKYRKKISGLYKANIYINKNYGIIIDLIKEEDIDFFSDMVDLKIILHENEEMYLSFDDYFLLKQKKIFFLNNKYYININSLNKKELLKMYEFCNIIYGDQVKELENNFKLISS